MVRESSAVREDIVLGPFPTHLGRTRLGETALTVVFTRSLVSKLRPKGVLT